MAAGRAFPALANADNSEDIVEIPDAILRGAVEKTLAKASGDPITRGEMETIQYLEADPVVQLDGIEYAVNLLELTLGGPSTSTLHRHGIADLAPLAGLTSLTQLHLPYHAIFDIAPLAGLKSLIYLDLEGNAISDLAPLAGLNSLLSLNLVQNEVTDLAPLVENDGLVGYGAKVARVDVRQNPLDKASLDTHIPALRGRGVIVRDDDSQKRVQIPDMALRDAVGRVLDKKPEYVTRYDMARLGTVVFHGEPHGSVVRQLDGIEYAYRLRSLVLDRNAISDLAPLAGLRLLTHIGLAGNEVTDAAPLVANDGLGEGDYVDLRRNPLGRGLLLSQITTLRKRGVEVDVLGWVTDLRNIPDSSLRLAAELSRRYGYDGDAEFGNRNGGNEGLALLHASSMGIEDLSGIGALRAHRIDLSANEIADISPLLEAGPLQWLNIGQNSLVEDWRPLEGVVFGFPRSTEYFEFLRKYSRYVETNLRGSGGLALDGNGMRELPSLVGHLSTLYAPNNLFVDIESLSSHLSLAHVNLNSNLIDSIEPLADKSLLRELFVNDNFISELPSLWWLYRLEHLHFRNNAVHDITPLLQGEGLVEVDVRGNPLSDDALGVLDALRERRVAVLAGEAVPYFPATGGSREGFVRVVNRSGSDGHVFIEAVDDAGVRAARVRLDVGARRTVQFNSADLENGNAARGISAGIGRPTDGDWRLEVISALDVEVLSYIRTEDGFVTPMHDTLPDAMAPFFNPGSERQQSILRMVNTEAEQAKWTTGGYDDSGKWHPMTGSLLVRPQHALTLTARALENTHGLGDGDGKWRLRVRGFPWFAMSLLESPAGHLANLSTVPGNATLLAEGTPDNATLLAESTTMYRVPLFPAAARSREGVVRVINRSYASGQVSIVAVDDQGNRSGPVELAIESRQAVQISSTDLERGNAAKGLVGRAGSGQGDWRLEITSELDLMVLSYVRTADGFLTSMHDLAPVAADGSHRVVFFNPGSARQVSKLRLINDGKRTASVAITGIDDLGSGSERVALAVPAGSALTFTSAQLEAGGRGLSGGLGDGDGKWRLRVRSDEEIVVMSLLETISGHLTNVSTGTAERRPPLATAPVPDQPLVIGSDAALDLSRHFSDDPTLIFEVESSDAGVVRVDVTGNALTLAPVAVGRATVTVRGRNEDGHLVLQTFQVIVRALLPERPLAVGSDATLDLSQYIWDEQTLTVDAESSDVEVVRVSVTGRLLTLAPLTVGRATITLMARNVDGDVAVHRFEVVVSADGEVGRLPPLAIAPVPSQPLAIGSDATLDLSRHFSDDQTLAFEVASSDANVVRVSVTGNVLTLAPVAEGYATVTVTARDPEGYVVQQTFQVLVSEDGQVGRRFRDCPECPEMVVVPAGSFMMGSPEDEEGGPRSDQRHERPQHRVEFAAPFAIGVFEVTYEQWNACVADGGCRDDVERHSFDETGPNHPVYRVNWNDAQAYVEWLSAKTGQAYRLPSDAEWEYAARAGTTTPFHFGEAITTDQANYDGEGFNLYEGDEPSSYAVANPGILRSAPVPVGSLPANPWGLHEVHGNVMEWTRDCFDGVGYAGWPADGSAVESGDCDRRYLRNGSYIDDPGDVRSARRQVRGTDLGYFSGFRVAKTLGD